MTRRRLFLLIFCLGAGMSIALAQQVRDATEVAPDFYRVLLENPYVRVVEFRAGAPAKIPMHSHPAYVDISLSSARGKMIAPDGKTAVMDLRLGQIIWSDGDEHAWEALVGDEHIITVEPKRAKPPAREAMAKDSTVVAPNVYRVALENENVRVVTIRAASGQKIPMHSHPAGVAVPISAVRLKFTSPDGKTEVVDSLPAQATWSDGLEHSVEVLADTLHTVIVEIKGGKAGRP